jgi:peptidyl-prolyl cis-trans isomerase D
MQDSVKTIDSLRIAGGQLGFEPKVVGAAFNTSNKGKMIGEPLSGVSGVYMVRVDDLGATSNTAVNIEEQKKQLRDRGRQMAAFYSSPSQVLRKIATVKDYRSKFF